MSDQTTEVERGEIVESPPGADPRESVSEPAKVMRIGSMIKQLLEEVRAAEMDDKGRRRLRDIYEQSITELQGALSEDLGDELSRLARPFDGEPVSDSEIRIAKAQLVGWLEGLFHGIQATLFAQQMAARQQLEQMRGQNELGQGQPERSPGTYL